MSSFCLFHGSALALAPVVDRGLSWFTVKFNFASEGKVKMDMRNHECFVLLDVSRQRMILSIFFRHSQQLQVFALDWPFFSSLDWPCSGHNYPLVLSPFCFSDHKFWWKRYWIVWFVWTNNLFVTNFLAWNCNLDGNYASN